MNWEQKALERMERVPFFIRKKVKKQIEKFVLDQGRDIVMDQDVSAARQQLAGGLPLNISSKPDSSLSEKDLAQIQKLVEKKTVTEELDTKHVKFRICGGAAGCPLALYDTKEQAIKLAQLVNEAGLEEFLAGSHDGPILFHHQFRIAFAGCPNSCSQPQITDFAIVGQSKPTRTEKECNLCGLCVEACKENALSLNSKGPVFNWDLCLNCGDCTRYCTQEAIVDGPATYRVSIGGKLGRHPHLAVTVGEQVDWETGTDLFKASVSFYREQAFDGERFANLVQRLGGETVRKAIQA